MKNEISLLKMARIKIQLANILMINDKNKLQSIISELNDKDVIKGLLLNNLFLSKTEEVIMLIEKLNENDCFFLLKNNKFLYNSNVEIINTVFAKLDESKRKNLLSDNEFVNKISNNTFLILFVTLLSKDNEIIILNPYIIERFTSKELLTMIVKNNNYIELLKDYELIKKIDGVSIASVLLNNNMIEEYFKNAIIPVNKAIMIINNLNISEQEKEELIRNNYHLEFTNFKQLYNDLIEKCNKDVQFSNCSDDLKILKNDLSGNLIIDDKTLIKEILNDQIKEPLIKEIIIKHLASQFAKKMNLNVDLSFADLQESDGVYNYIFNTLVINKKYLENNLNVELLNTMFHEFVHASQYSQVTKLDYKYDNLKMVKDIILSTEIASYKEDNYWENSIEVDARCKGFLLTYRLLKMIDEKKAYDYLKLNILEYKKNVRLRKEQYRKGNMSLKISLQECFAKQISKEQTKLYIEKYPILKLEYDENTGEKKDIVLLFSEYVSLKIKSKELDKSSIEYKKYIFYENYFNDKKKIYKETGIKETIDEYQEDFIKLRNSSYYAIEEYKVEIDKYINMQNIYFNKNQLESASNGRQ